MERAIEMLKPDDQMLLHLYYFDDRPMHEIAIITEHEESHLHSSTAVTVTDSLDYYIDKIERELTQVDESLYIERMAKVIRADERLQRIVSSYILHTLDKEGRPQTADNMYNVKSEQDEE